MTTVRPLRGEDYEQVLGLARAAAEESMAHLGFDQGVFDDTFHRALVDRPAVFVAERDDRVLVGFVLCVARGYWYSSGISTALEVIYVRPGSRGTRAPALLLARFIEWSRELGARQKFLGIDNSLHPERTARFFARAGARAVGYAMVI